MNDIIRKHLEQQYFEDAVTHAGKPIASATGRDRRQSTYVSINASNILDRLIESAGRFCEHYSSDLFITWDYIKSLINDHESGHYCVVVAPRKNGVDSNSYVLSTANNYCNQSGRITDYYRQIFAIIIDKTIIINTGLADDELDITVNLYDITNHLPRIKTDLNGQSQLEFMYPMNKTTDNPASTPKFCDLTNKPVNNICLDAAESKSQQTIIYPCTDKSAVSEWTRVYISLSKICPALYGLPHLINLFDDLQKHSAEWNTASESDRNRFYANMNGLNAAIHELSELELSANTVNN